jgi:hypothetical protein
MLVATSPRDRRNWRSAEAGGGRDPSASAGLEQALDGAAERGLIDHGPIRAPATGGKAEDVAIVEGGRHGGHTSGAGAARYRRPESGGQGRGFTYIRP